MAKTVFAVSGGATGSRGGIVGAHALASPGSYPAHSPSGLTLYVDSNGIGAGTTQRLSSPRFPYSTVAAALADARLNDAVRYSEGAHILVADGHAESIAAADGWPMPDVRTAIIGQGYGTGRPLISIGTAVTAGITIAKTACMIANMRFATALDAIEDVIEIGSAGEGFMLFDCDFFGGSTLEAETFIKISHADADNVHIARCSFRQRTAGGVQAIEITGTCDNLIIEDCHIFGDFDNAAIQSAVVHTDCRILNNWIANLQTGDHAIQFSGAATGLITGTRGFSTLAAALTQTAIDQGSCYVGDNLLVDATADKAMITNPVLDV